MWFLPRMYRLSVPADPQLIEAARQAGHAWVKAHPKHAANVDLLDRERKVASRQQLASAASQEERVFYQAAWLVGALTPPDEGE